MKNGMQMLVESLLPHELIEGIAAAAKAIPIAAQKLQEQMDRMEMVINNIDAAVARIENKVRGDEPPERTPLSDYVLTAISEGEYRNGETRKTVLPSMGNGEFPETLRKELEKDDRAN